MKADVDPLLALIPTRPLRANNLTRARIIIDKISELHMRHHTDKAELAETILAHIEWAQREAVARMADNELLFEQEPAKQITKA